MPLSANLFLNRAASSLPLSVHHVRLRLFHIQQGTLWQVRHAVCERSRLVRMMQQTKEAGGGAWSSPRARGCNCQGHLCAEWEAQVWPSLGYFAESGEGAQVSRRAAGTVIRSNPGLTSCWRDCVGFFWKGRADSCVEESQVSNWEEQMPRAVGTRVWQSDWGGLWAGAGYPCLFTTQRGLTGAGTGIPTAVSPTDWHPSVEESEV